MTAAHLTILRLLADGPRLGQELVDRSEGALCRGTVYVHLAALEDDGLVASEEEPREGALAPRRRYRLTDGGRRALAAEDERNADATVLSPW